MNIKKSTLRWVIKKHNKGNVVHFTEHVFKKHGGKLKNRLYRKRVMRITYDLVQGECSGNN